MGICDNIQQCNIQLFSLLLTPTLWNLQSANFLATGQRPLFQGLFFGGGQNIKKREVFAAARLDVGPFFFYLIFIFWLLC